MVPGPDLDGGFYNSGLLFVLARKALLFGVCFKARRILDTVGCYPAESWRERGQMNMIQILTNCMLIYVGGIRPYSYIWKNHDISSY